MRKKFLCVPVAFFISWKDFATIKCKGLPMKQKRSAQMCKGKQLKLLHIGTQSGASPS